MISTSPATLFGGTWEKIESRFLYGADGTYSVGTEIEAGLPDVKGTIRCYSDYNKKNSGYDTQGVSGPFQFKTGTDAETGSSYNQDDSKSNDAVRTVRFGLSYANSIYGKSDTVMPQSIAVNIWKRTA